MRGDTAQVKPAKKIYPTFAVALWVQPDSVRVKIMVNTISDEVTIFRKV